MKRKNKEIKSLSMLPFPFLTFSLLFSILIPLGIGLFLFTYETAREQFSIGGLCAVGVVCFGLAIAAIICGLRKAFSIIKIDESGVRLLIFGFIKVLEMKWDNIAEIKYYERFVPFIFISKTKSLYAKTYDYIIRQRDVIQVQLSKKVYKVITKYIQQPIEGLTEEKLTLLKLK